MTIKSIGLLALVAILLVATSIVTANAQSHPLSTKTDARTLIQEGDYDQALLILRSLAREHPKDTQVLFLTGLAAIEKSRHPDTREEDRYVLLDEAIGVLHTILIDQPNLERVRLELARSFFYKQEDRLARRHFERVLAGKPPPPVVENVLRFLAEMRARRRWSMYLGSTLKPSTNIGRNSNSEIINVFGFPFRRDTAETEKSGIGLSIWTGGEYRLPLGDRLRLRIGSDAAREEYPGKRFDQTFLAGHIGPHWLFDANTSVSLLGDARQRWLETAPYYLDLGARSELRHRLTQRVLLSGHLSWYDREYRTHTYLDGSIFDFSLNGTWTITPITQLEASSGYAYEHPQSKRWRNNTRWVRIGASYALPRGFTLGGNGEYRQTRYEGNWFPFTTGIPRKDRTRILRASLYNRGITLYGFSPQLVATYEKRDTNAQLYDYDSTSGELRFVRQF